MATWDVSLPTKPLYRGGQLSPVDQTIRTDMEFGSAKSRRRTAYRNDQISTTWAFTDAQMATFRGWFDDDAAGGTEWFGGLSLYMGDGGATSVECRFVGPFSAVITGPNSWEVTAKLEVRNA